MIGGGAEFVANVFAGTTQREPAVLSIDPGIVAERGSTEMNGSGAIEMLAREMTAELHAIRARVIQEATAAGSTQRLPLKAKGISFGFVSSKPTGELQLHEIEGIDRDLVVRPWLQKGTVTSLRTFTVTAMNHHHGMQPVERFGMHLTGTRDFDHDGVTDELTEGDITALVVWQASLNVPGRVIPREPQQRSAVSHGEQLFNQVGCSSCHVPRLVLQRPVYSEPGPYNLEGTLNRREVTVPFEFDLTKDGPLPRLERQSDGSAIVRAFTDLKRHKICDREKQHFCNENLVQGFARTDQFITRRLWGVGNTDPYGHRADLTTIREAILNHGGEARGSRIGFEELSTSEQESVVAFLKSLQIVPEGSAQTVQEAVEVTLPYQPRERDRAALGVETKPIGRIQ
ncbi:di-heme oxidoredictase family protein [Sinorhizobium meliloti]|uniref:di-heme oxidoredictase family protein n=2 Tax=Rhizobium meliloti TaxID=382 RepID=UPI0013E2B4A7|nr:di-heme oxidoredictase family protein [Sinorhizobium meliloti]